jgi:putative modified peptide
MADRTLDKKQVMTLYSKLATDDVFRKSFEEKPARALFDMGVPADLIVDLNAACLHPCTLASKQAFSEALRQLKDEVTECTTQMIIPSLRLDYGRQA